jgi:LysR family transcriptional activator of mexEF-oprN operon
MAYARDLDLNLLRIFVVVAETGSVTKAAERLYVTQPAISAALARLNAAVGAPLFVRQGRGLTLSVRGERLLDAARPHLQALVDATRAAPPFDPATSDRTLRIGLSDAAEAWLLPALLRRLATDAPRIRVIVLPVQFRTVEDALVHRRVDLAVTVADTLPSSITRVPLLAGEFACVFDPRHARFRRLTADEYFARDHVIVSYNGDLRGVVEDVTGRQRRVRCSLPSFAHVGDVVDGTGLLATVPAPIAAHLRAVRPHLATAPLPFALRSDSGLELLWPIAIDDDPACRYLRGEIAAVAEARPPASFVLTKRRRPR